MLLTNLREFGSSTIAAIYKDRWEIELFFQALQQNLKVMDSTAISMCMDHDLPIIVFNLRKPGNIKRAVMGEAIGTRVERGSGDAPRQ